MSRYLQAIFFFLLFGLFINQARSQEALAGSDLTYKYLGANFYRFTLTTYTDCEGGFTLIQKVPITLASSQLGVDTTIYLDRQGEYEPVRIFCEDRKTLCEDGTERGLQKAVFHIDINLGSMVANDWIVYNKSVFLSKEITTVQDVGVGGTRSLFYLNYLELDNTSENRHSSPISDASNIVIGLVGQESRAFVGATEFEEGHRLEYSLATPENDLNDPLTYKSGYNQGNPVSSEGGVTISQDGYLTFTPTSEDEVSVIDLVITEYDENDQEVGVTRRLININTFEGDNQAPIGQPFSDDTYEMVICENTIFYAQEEDGPILDIKFYDPDGNLKTVSRPSVPFGYLSQRSSGDTVIFRWIGEYDNTNPSLLGEHELVFDLADDGCPISLTNRVVYTVTLYDSPEVELPADSIKDCISNYRIEQDVTEGLSPYQYSWTGYELNEYGLPGSGESLAANADNDLDIVAPGLYVLEVTDANGCTDDDSILIDNPIEAGFKWDDFCVGDTTSFTDTSKVSIGNIISHDWEYVFNDSTLATSDLANPKYVFEEVGDYEIFLTVESDNGCREKVRNILSICDHPELFIDVSDSCHLDPEIIFTDVTAHEQGCGVYSRRWEIRTDTVRDYARLTNYVQGEDSTSIFRGAYFPVQFRSEEVPDTGTYFVDLIVKGYSGCIDTLRDSFIVHQRPSLDVLQAGSFNYNCDQGDTLINASLKGSKYDGTPPLWYGWTNEFGTILDSGTITADTLDMPLDITLDEPGTYLLTVLDSNNCHDTVHVRIKQEIDPDFKHSIVCEANQEIQFQNETNSHFPQVKWEWDFESDGTIDDTTENPVYTYASQGFKRVSLTVYDSVGCSQTSSFGDLVYNTVVDSSIVFSRNPVCVNDEFSVQGIRTHSAGSVFSTLKWTVNGDSLIFSEIGPNVYKGFNIRYEEGFDEIGAYPFTSEATFNYHPELHINADSTCFISRTDTIYVNRQDFEVETSYDFTCYGNNTEFYIEQLLGEGEIEYVEWHIHETRLEDPIDTVYGFPSSYKYTGVVEGETKELYIDAVAIDNVGCVDTARFDIAILDIDLPTLEYHDTVCTNLDVPISLYVHDGIFDIGGYESYEFYHGDSLVAQYESNSIISDGRYNWQPGDPWIEYFEPVVGGGGANDTLLYVFGGLGGDNEVSIRAYISEGVDPACKFAQLDTTIYTIPIDTFDIQTLPPFLCANEGAIRLSYDSFGEELGVVSWNWSVEDSTYSGDTVFHYFSVGGYHEIGLVVEDTNSCVFDLVDTIYVKDAPNADFQILNEDIIMGELLEFNENVVLAGIGSDTIEITSYFWDFGDGTTSTEANPNHEYDEIDVYDVTLIVGTEEECFDTLYTTVDLYTYLDIPTAFTPNGDGTNDVISLVSKSIHELYVFKIFNRWGEVVFDAEGDIDAGWDGTYKGVDQELGVYIVHVHGLDAYDEEFNFQRKVTLIR